MTLERFKNDFVERQVNNGAESAWKLREDWLFRLSKATWFVTFEAQAWSDSHLALSGTADSPGMEELPQKHAPAGKAVHSYSAP